MIKFIDRLWARLHRHRWSGTAWNPVCIEVEQMCSCGERRHRTPGIPENGPWQPGPHPKVEALRAAGLTQTVNWKGWGRL